MADPFQALAHPARRELIDELRAGPRRAGDLGSGLAMTREARSKHLRLLQEAGLVTAEASGRERWYRLEPEALREVDQWITPFRALWAQRLDALETEVARGRLQRRRESGPARTATPDARGA